MHLPTGVTDDYLIHSGFRHTCNHTHIQCERICPAGKVYKTPEEEARRKHIWLSNHAKVLAHNAEADQGKHTWWMGMNQFSDLVRTGSHCVQKWVINSIILKTGLLIQ